jgi:two-component system, NarL family, response regulator
MHAIQKAPAQRLRSDRNSLEIESVVNPARTPIQRTRLQKILPPRDHSIAPLDSGHLQRSDIDLAEGGSSLPQLGRARSLKVLVADNHPVVREGLVSLIHRQTDMRVVADASNGREAVDKFLAHSPDVALIDLRMPVMDGIDTVISICEKQPGARIVIVTSYQNEEDIYRALRAGAQGYLLKDATVEEFVDCIHGVSGGETWIPRQVGAKLARRMSDQQLTRREMDVLKAVTTGKSNKEVGVVFDISEATVKVHMTHILGKLKVTGRTEAINVAVKRGLVHMDGYTST